MKLHEAFFLSLISSLFVGAFLFLGIPLASYFVTIESHDNLFHSNMLLVLFGFYVIYAGIQLTLSTINLLQIVHFRSIPGLSSDRPRMVRYFLIAEVFLYLIVFVVMISLVGLPEFVPAVLLFSIPYVICCTASIFIFLYFLDKVHSPHVSG